MIHIETIAVYEDTEELSEILEYADEYIGLYFTEKDSIPYLTYTTREFIKNYTIRYHSQIDKDKCLEVANSSEWYVPYETFIIDLISLFGDTSPSYSLEAVRFIESTISSHKLK